jgi:hypothetical protein
MFRTRNEQKKARSDLIARISATAASSSSQAISKPKCMSFAWRLPLSIKYPYGPSVSFLSSKTMLDNSYFDSLMIRDQHKFDLANLYCRQPYAVEIIQLVEVPPPARRFPIDSSSIASSSSSCYSSECESEYSSEAESAGSSYCSSDSSEQMNSEEEEVSKPDETYGTRVTRVHAWRASFAKDMGIGSYFLPSYASVPFIDRYDFQIFYRYNIQNAKYQMTLTSTMTM